MCPDRTGEKLKCWDCPVRRMVPEGNLYCRRVPYPSELTPMYFYPRSAMLARVLTMAVRPSVCVCVCHKSVFYRNGRTNRVGLWHGSFFPPILHCVLRKFRYLQELGYFSLELCSKLWTSSPRRSPTKSADCLVGSGPVGPGV